jgi:hypothetical protein
MKVPSTRLKLKTKALGPNYLHPHPLPQPCLVSDLVSVEAFSAGFFSADLSEPVELSVEDVPLLDPPLLEELLPEEPPLEDEE